MDSIIVSQDYKIWLSDLKSQIRQSQLKAAVKVNVELLRLYWDMGKDITTRRFEAAWGSGFFEQLSRDLRKEFPDIRGFSITNLRYIKRFYLFYTEDALIRHQLGGEFEHPIFHIPWRHHIELLSKCKTTAEALFYINEIMTNGWSRAVLQNMLDTNLYQAKGKAITNFSEKLPVPMSDLATQTLKDPYSFDFLAMRKDYDERELENALVENITRFLLELGSGFAFVGKQVRLEIGGQEFFVDLLFYHLKLRCFIVVELKVTDFEPSYLGQLGFYVTAINETMRHPNDAETIGLLICRHKNKLVAEYALKNMQQPLGISEYTLRRVMPEQFKSSLPTIEEIESGLNELTN